VTDAVLKRRAGGLSHTKNWNKSGVNMFGFKLKNVLSASSTANGDDVLGMKQALNHLGEYDPPAYGMTPYPDTPMFDGMKAFQKKNGLTVDGFARPGGPTETTLNSRLANGLNDFSVKRVADFVSDPKKSSRPMNWFQPAYIPGTGKEVTRPTVHFFKKAIQQADGVEPALRLGRAVGLGQVNRPQDVIGLKNALAWAGHYPVDKAHQQDATPDEELHWALMGFQRDYGLKTDGFSRPGGETESRINELISPLIKRASATTAQTRSAAPSLDEPQTQIAKAEPSQTSHPMQLAQAQGSPSGKTGVANTFVPTQQSGPASTTTVPKSLTGIDLSFLHAQEGYETNGYVPEKNGVAIDNSGVTIGAGVDLGQMNDYDLNQLIKNHGLDPVLAQKVKPYLGLKRGQAQTYLAQNPITLTKPEAEQLTDAKYSKIAGDLIKRYDAEMAKTGSSSTFASLPDKLKTVALSVALQHGPALDLATRRFWSALTNQDTNAMESELRNFSKDPLYKFNPRRNREADYLTQP
jgi:lysozyme-like predicted toxin